MPLAAAHALTDTASPGLQPVETGEALLTAYREHLARTGRGNSAYQYWAKVFVERWPDPQAWAQEPLEIQLQANSGTRPFITFRLVTGRLHPSWQYLVHRKFSSLWRDVVGTTIGEDLDEFIVAARACDYSEQTARAMASQVLARVLFATGKRLGELTDEDFEELNLAGQQREQVTGPTWKHYRGCATATRTVLFHHKILPAPPPPAQTRWPYQRRLAEIPEPMKSLLIGYLERKAVTCKPSTVSGLTTRLVAFATFVTSIDATLTPDRLERCAHIETWMSSLPQTISTATGRPLTPAEQARRILAVSNFLTEITEWGWPNAPARKLMFRSDVPRLPQPLPRFLCRPTRTGAYNKPSKSPRTGSAPTRCCCNAPADSASVNCSTSNSMPSSTCPAPAPG